MKLIVNPNKTDVSVGSEAVALTAKASGSGLQFEWKLQGPGKIEGSGSAIFYHIPAEIEGESAQAMITVTVTDEAGQETTETFTFNILAKETTAAASPAASADEGMSMTTKVAIGVGAAALVGAGIALAAGGDDDESTPFSGTFQRSVSGTSTRGNPYTEVHVLELNQDGSTLSGTMTFTSTLTNCCTAIYGSTVSGTASDSSGVLNWAATEGYCTCSWTSWAPDDGGATSASVTLSDDTLTFAGGAELSRTSKEACPSEDGAEKQCTVQSQGSFVR